MLLAGFWVQAVSISGLCSILAQPAGPSVENLANVSFIPDIRVFAVMAALNVAGFDYENQQQSGMSEVRKSLREELTSVDPELRIRLQAFYVEHGQNLAPPRLLAAYISLALLINGPPDFSLTVDKKDLPEEAAPVVGFEELVCSLHEKVNLGELWKRYQGQYAARAAEYRPVFVDVIQQTLDYFRIPPRVVLDRQIMVIPDLLGPRQLVNARNVGKAYYIIPGPAEKAVDHRTQLQHEYLHFLLDPLIDKFKPIILKHEKLLDLAQNQPHIRPEFQNQYMMVVGESLIESLVLKLNPTRDLNRSLVGLFRDGLIFAPYFFKALGPYEADVTLTMPVYVETLFTGVGEKAIRAEEAWVAELEKRYDQEQAAKLAATRQEQQRMLRHSYLRNLLVQAQELMRQQKYSEASAKLEELLKEDPGSAQAYFNLAQIASQRQEHERAFELYRRAEESPSSTPAVRAWSKLRMGNYLAFLGRFEEARIRFNEVVALEGELEGARERAREALEELAREK